MAAYSNERVAAIILSVLYRMLTKYGYSLDKAMDTFYNSETFACLQNHETGLYYQSPGYVYSFLSNELNYCDYRR